MKRSSWALIGVTICLLLGGVFTLLHSAPPGRHTTILNVALQATTTPTIGPVSATPSLITVNTPTSVLITAQILDTRLIPDSVNLLRVNGAGRSVVVATMRDDGTNRDQFPNDRTFTASLNVNETRSGQIRLQVSAAFRGMLQRVISPEIPITVLHTVTLEQDTRILLSRLLSPHGVIVPDAIFASSSHQTQELLVQWDTEPFPPVFSVSER